MGPKRIKPDVQLALILVKCVNLLNERIHLPLPDIGNVRDTDLMHPADKVIVDQIHLLWVNVLVIFHLGFNFPSWLPLKLPIAFVLRKILELQQRIEIIVAFTVLPIQKTIFFP